ncbi:MAG TPA: glucose 1-dehydrogenase [Chloroflexota bacterium]|jgi:2-deoxy-D-gluconate 3-dehydrogenase|nr:glucose 1-dehydrogenase [Chloroflexota bacterium]
MDPFDLHGKVAIVTGGNGGIGLGIARGLAQAGACVTIAGRNEEKTSAAQAELGEQCLGMRVDVTNTGDVQRMVQQTVDRFGGLDIMVANAGMNIRKPPQDYTLDEWHTIVDTNLTSMFTCSQAAYPELRRRGGGKILTIGSMASIFGFDVAPIYAATKGGAVQLTRSLASAWAKDNIQVNCILPGWIETDLTRRARQVVSGLHERVVDRTPARRWGTPADLAGAAVFFCSSASDFITGTALPVDGGFSSSMF